MFSVASDVWSSRCLMRPGPQRIAVRRSDAVFHLPVMAERDRGARCGGVACGVLSCGVLFCSVLPGSDLADRDVPQSEMGGAPDVAQCALSGSAGAVLKMDRGFLRSPAPAWPGRCGCAPAPMRAAAAQRAGRQAIVLVGRRTQVAGCGFVELVRCRDDRAFGHVSRRCRTMRKNRPLSSSPPGKGGSDFRAVAVSGGVTLPPSGRWRVEC